MALSNNPVIQYNKINNTILWDCRKFIKYISTNRFLEIDSSLTRIDDDLLSLNKITFNVKSTIYENSKSIDIINAWNYCKKVLPIEKFLTIFLTEYILKVKKRPIADYEPDIIELVRLVYWIYECSRFENFDSKMEEIKCKLGKGLLKNFDKYKLSKSIDDITFNNELNTLIEKQKLQQFTDVEKKQFANYMKNWFKESFGFNSELISSFLSSQTGFKIFFDKSNSSNFAVPKHDYDYIIDTYPVQVKTYTIYKRHAEVDEKLSDKGLKKERLHLERMNEIKQNHLDNKLTWNQVQKEVIDSIISNRDEFLKAINKQKTKIIVFNGTQSVGGYALSLYMLEAENNSSFCESIKKSMDVISKLENKNIPLIFYSSGDYIRYYTAALCFKLPCINNHYEIDYSSIKKIELV